MSSQRRQYFRIEYPRTCRPALILQGRTYAVTDLSEYGVKFQVADTGPFGLGLALEMIIRFVDGEECRLAGEITRTEKNTVCLLLTEPVPLKRIRSEELYLIKNFPALRSRM